jgi:hypothetical protein
LAEVMHLEILIGAVGRFDPSLQRSPTHPSESLWILNISCSRRLASDLYRAAGSEWERLGRIAWRAAS